MKFLLDNSFTWRWSNPLPGWKLGSPPFSKGSAEPLAVRLYAIISASALPATHLPKDLGIVTTEMPFIKWEKIRREEAKHKKRNNVDHSAVTEFHEPLNDAERENFFKRFPGMTLEALAVPEELIAENSAQFSELPPPDGLELFTERLELLASINGWNIDDIGEIWSNVLPWELFFDWFNLGSCLRELHSDRYPAKVEPQPQNDKAVRTRLWAEGIIYGDDPNSPNGRKVANLTSEEYSLESNGSIGTPVCAERSTTPPNTTIAYYIQDQALARFASAPHYGTLDEVIGLPAFPGDPGRTFDHYLY